MGQRAVLDVSSPPKAASSAAACAVSSEPSHSSSSSPSPSPSSASAGEASDSAVSGPGPGAAVAATVPSGGIVPPVLPVVAPTGSFGPPSFLVGPPPALPTDSALPPPLAPEPGASAPASDMDTADDAAVADALGALEDEPGAPSPTAATPSVVEVSPPPGSAPAPRAPGTMTWGELQAELRETPWVFLDAELLNVPAWPSGEPGFHRICRWRRRLGVAVDTLDNILVRRSLRPRTQLLVTALRNRYAQQLLFVREGYRPLYEQRAREPAIARAPSPATPSRRVCEVVMPPVPAGWPAPPRSTRPPPAAGPSKATSKRAREEDGANANASGSPSEKRRKKAPSSASGRRRRDPERGSREPCDRCTKKGLECVEYPGHFPCYCCVRDHMKCSWSDERPEVRAAAPPAPRGGRRGGGARRARGGLADPSRPSRSPPAPLRAPPAGSLLPDAVLGVAAAGQPVYTITPDRLNTALVGAARAGADMALEGVAHLLAPRSAMRAPAEQRVRFGSPMDTAAPAGESSSRPPTEPPSTPGSRRGGRAEEEEEEEDAGPGGSKDAGRRL
ncbi:hypothetical protein AURDEDRAFT_177849 [Auricularia subglabra TFB-10046 SS5]|uniref:Zn(2)-C6 fungal-type domain-containing protein n=1 Tax=Auricularia subglabra (strain TFB-10046 / SS5) TaxID=717982 RepID=J0WMM3_AURST|nr:hypothetical protein AURDEDRAFT_177849 [Auricularia subglabra TFB-10046 SS5]